MTDDQRPRTEADLFSFEVPTTAGRFRIIGPDTLPPEEAARIGTKIARLLALLPNSPEAEAAPSPESLRAALEQALDGLIHEVDLRNARGDGDFAAGIKFAVDRLARAALSGRTEEGSGLEDVSFVDEEWTSAVALIYHAEQVHGCDHTAQARETFGLASPTDRKPDHYAPVGDPARRGEDEATGR